MKRHLFLVVALAALLFAACTEKDEPHFFNDQQQRTDIKNDLKAKKALLPNESLFSILDDKELNSVEREALQFLYAYMPVGDITDYTGEYHLENVRIALRAKEELPWGKDIPEREFNHFVVPTRVNNESLDRFRSTYYEELKARVKDLSLADAALEVNHWCHERVNYKGSDSRTSAPMATIKTSWGRCGEESTLLVTALRTVGIPARQVYTPRWAHSDDNHAWVEAYVDGGWHFMGACEPEPVLDLGWFNEPASRALLLHTRVFGDYQGPEEVIARNKNYTEINVTDNYAETGTSTITVVDAEGNPIPDIPVEFKIYNYSEYCTVATKNTDEQGKVQLTTGLGSMMAYAAHNGRFGFTVFNGSKDNEVGVMVDHDPGLNEQMRYDITAPSPNAIIPEVTPEARAENDRRLAYEDSLRNAYIAQCKSAQEQLNAATGNKSLGALYAKTWGNYQTIADFAKAAEGKGQLTQAVMLLQSLSDKDLRDVSLEVLNDHLEGWTSDSPYVYGPRVSNEKLVPYRKAFASAFAEAEAKSFKAQPQQLVEWVKNNIRVNDELNPQRIPITPTGVMQAKVADRHSRDIFFVAMARSLGIAAQINPVNGKVQYQEGESWKDVDFEAAEATTAGIGYLDILYKPTEALPDPKYYSNFSIKKYDGNSFKLLAYDAQDPGIDDGMNLSSFANLPLEAGYYILTGGTRLSNGNVLTTSKIFSITEGDTIHIPLELREPTSIIQSVGNVGNEMHFTNAATGKEQKISSLNKNCYVLAFLDQGSEPTTHAMQDLVKFSKPFDKVGIPMYFLFKDAAEYEKFKLKEFAPLPETVVYGYYDEAMMKKATSTMKVKGLPVIALVTSENDVVFVKQGYSIGLPQQLLKVVMAL